MLKGALHTRFTLSDLFHLKYLKKVMAVAVAPEGTGKGKGIGLLPDSHTETHQEKRRCQGMAEGY